MLRAVPTLKMDGFCKGFVALVLAVRFVTGDYIAAVVEYNTLNFSDPFKTLEENVNNYVYEIGMAGKMGAQIIVFPEYGLTGVTVNPENYSFALPSVGSVPRSSGTADFNYLLNKFSNVAIENDIYVVVNLLEQETTTRNGKNDTLYYNTNVVFDNGGRIAAKYRKMNLFKESRLTPGTEPVTFTTSFGTFALIICMDILYYNPAESVLVNNTVTDVIFPTAWFSMLPFYMSLDVQAGYAASNGVNLLAANLNNPSQANGGSGIYRRDGVILRQALTGTPTTKMLYANVESRTQTRVGATAFGFDILNNNTVDTISGYNPGRIFDYNAYSFKSLNLSNGTINTQVCDGPFCCNFNIVVDQSEVNPTEVYKLLAYDGRVLYDTDRVPARFCHLIACLTDDVKTCGERRSFTTKFRRIAVWGNFGRHHRNFYRPNTLRGDLRPIANVSYAESAGNKTIGVSLNTTTIADNVILFGLYATGGCGSEVALSFVVAVATLIAHHFL